MSIRHPFEVVSDRGEERVLSGKQTLNLVGHDHAWYVLEGRADIFVVDVDGGQDPFVSIEKGNLFFPFGSEIDADKGAYFRASGIPGTKLVELPIPVIDGLATDAVGRLYLVELVNQWLEKASRGVIRHVQPRPRIDRQITVPAENAALVQGTRVSAANEPCWISGSADKFLFVGMEVFSRSDCIIPLTQQAWIEAIGTAQIKVQSTEALLLSGGLWSSLANWHNVLLACEQLNGRLAAVDEYNRLILRQERDEQKRHMAFSDLRAIVDGRAMDTDVIIDRIQDRPLLAIVGRVAQACHVKIHIPAQRPPDKDNAPDTLDALLDPSSTRSRIVRLPAGWERKELGPLIGWTKDEGLPVALIPTSGQRYQAYLPGVVNPQKVDMSLIQNLRDDAVMLYRSFGHERIRGRDLVSFGLKGAYRDILTIFGGVIATGFLGWLFPYALGTALNTAIPSGDTSLLLTLVVALIVSVGAIAASQIAQGVAILRIESRFDSATGAAVMDRLLKLSPTFLRKFASGDLGLRALALSTMRQQVSAMLVNAVLPSISGLLSIGLIWILSPAFAIFTSFLVFILLVVITLMARRHLDFQHRVHAAQGQLASLLLDMIANIAKLRVASAEGMAFARWAKLFSLQQRDALQSRKIFARLSVVLSLLPAAALLVILYGTSDDNVSSLGPGRLVAMQIALIQIVSALTILCPTIFTLVGTLPQYERMAVLLHAQPEVKPQSRAPGELSGGLEMSHVSFRYDANGPLVLDDVNMRVEPGEFVAIVGTSGCGKSTVLRLLLGFENPERGTVTFDAEDLTQLDVTAVRKQMGVVLQHSRLMPGTIFNNIVGAKQLSMQEAWQAARLARVDDDIRAMPMGMHSMTGDGAAALSGGQRQRILIARALASRPRILLFDEATSALDNLTQAEVMQSLEDLPITRIVIAHRLSTITKANRIFVMQDGRIAQHGRYEELISTPGPFQDIVTRQKI